MWLLLIVPTSFYKTQAVKIAKISINHETKSYTLGRMSIMGLAHSWVGSFTKLQLLLSVLQKKNRSFFFFSSVFVCYYNYSNIFLKMSKILKLDFTNKIFFYRNNNKIFNYFCPIIKILSTTFILQSTVTLYWLEYSIRTNKVHKAISTRTSMSDLVNLRRLLFLLILSTLK